MAVNIPSLNVNAIGEGLKDQNNYEAILDVLQRYRKELNFYLMNLDLDNMPVVAENIDGLHGRMETVDGQVSEFIQTVDGFQTTVSNYQGEVSQFTQTVDGFQTTVANYQGEVSQFTQTVDGFQTTVANYQGEVSQFTQTVNGFQSQVSNYASEVGTFNSTISQLAGQVSSKVSYTDYTGVNLVSMIEQTAANIKLSASKIDLSGVTTIYGNNGYTRMGGTGLSIVSPFDNTFKISWDTYIGYELGRGVTSKWPDVVWFDGSALFNGYVNFSDATIEGLELRFA